LHVTGQSSGSGRRAILLTTLAFLWSIGLVIAALVVPFYGSATLVDENGRGVLLWVGAPAAVTLVAWLALWHRCSRGGRGSGYLAWACVYGLIALSLVGILSIGLFIAPAAVLLAFAVSGTPAGSGLASRRAA
jgi:hypothetical protein